MKTIIKSNGVLTNFNKYTEYHKNEKRRAYKEAIKLTSKDTKEELFSVAKTKFKVKTNNFKNVFTSKVYDARKEDLPSVLFYTRTHYSKIFETGGVIKARKAKGLFIPFINSNERLTTKKTKNMLDVLKSSKKSFWKRVNGVLFLFAETDKTNSRLLTKTKNNYKQRNGLKKLDQGTIIPVGMLKKSINIKSRFDYTNIAKQAYIPKVIKKFNDLLNL